MNYKNLLLSVSEDIAKVTINRPTKLNALNSETLMEIEKAFNYIKNEDNIKVTIVTGAGEKAFVAGADISELKACNSESGKTFSEQGQKVFDLIENLRKPVIAAINGFALGGGCELALACHIRLASENAKFGQPEVNLGIIPGYGGTQRLSRLINTGRALEYILTGNLINSEEALRIGLINRIIPNEELIHKAEEMAKLIASKGQIAVGLALESVLSTNNLNQSEGLKLESELFGKCCGSEDFNEGTTAFLEKRKPHFKR